IRDRSHWNIANITPKDPVTLGLTTQRELDAAVAKAAKVAGLEAPVDTRLEGDREALITELRAQRDQAARDAEAVENGEVIAPRAEPTAETLFKR
uniref:cell cycle transcriptional regulator TrcR n=1 Tax=uncultured Sphingomonas sp. TaxID=158754 RepID=UPI0035CA97E0